MDADAAVNLIVQPDLAIRHVVVAAQLNAIHAEIRVLEARLVGMLGVDLRQRDEGPAVVRPALELWQLIERRLAFNNRSRANTSRPH